MATVPKAWPWLLESWHRVSESHLRHACVSVSFCVVLICFCRGLSVGLTPPSRESYEMSSKRFENLAEKLSEKLRLRVGCSTNAM